MKKSFGFTMIELLVVVTIILMVSGGLMAYYNTFSDEKRLDAETRKLADTLELAKKKAGAGDDSCSGSNLTGYQVVLTSSSYSLEQCCGTSGSCSTTTSLITQSITNPQITIQNTGTYRFKLLSTGVQAVGIGNTVQIKHSVGKCMDIYVHNTGLIDVRNWYSSGC